MTDDLTPEHGVDLARTVRRLQRAYFADRTPARLQESKDAERRLDRWLEEYDAAKRPSLFGGGS